MYSELLTQSREEDRAAVIPLGSYEISVAGAASSAEGDHTKGSALMGELGPRLAILLCSCSSVALIT